MRTLLKICCLLFLAQGPAVANPAAKEPVPSASAPVVTGTFETLKHTKTLRVERIIDAKTILMKDGTVVALTGLTYPAEAQGEIPQIVWTARERLLSLLPEGTEVILYQSRTASTGRLNRMGQQRAHLVAKKDERWINGTLIAEGFGWVMTDPDLPDMADQLYKYEEIARSAKSGLWADAAYAVADTSSPGNFSGGFTVAQGRVESAATSKNKLYLNFGSDRRTDFTVMIPADLRKRMARTQTDLFALNGRMIRVRGWVRAWNGPFMELAAPEHLEILDTGTAPSNPPNRPSDPSPDFRTDLSPDPVEKQNMDQVNNPSGRLNP